MATVNAEFVKRQFDTLDDVEVARVVALGATEHDVVEARGWIDGEDELIRRLGEPSNPRVEEIVAIVEASLPVEEEIEV